MKMNPRAISYVNTIVSEKIPHESSVCVCAAPGSRGQSLRLVASLSQPMAVVLLESCSLPLPTASFSWPNGDSPRADVCWVFMSHVRACSTNPELLGKAATENLHAVISEARDV